MRGGIVHRFPIKSYRASAKTLKKTDQGQKKPRQLAGFSEDQVPWLSSMLRICPIALVGLSPLGQISVQFMMV